MTPHSFYRQYEDTRKEDRFDVIRTHAEPTSLFVIFKQLSDVQAQLRYFQERETHLLKLAEYGFQQIKSKNG
jgi:hypothetical protein